MAAVAGPGRILQGPWQGLSRYRYIAYFQTKEEVLRSNHFNDIEGDFSLFRKFLFL